MAEIMTRELWDVILLFLEASIRSNAQLHNLNFVQLSFEIIFPRHDKQKILPIPSFLVGSFFFSYFSM